MAKRTAAQIYQSLTDAGFTGGQAVVMTAISLAESGGDDTELGDVGLENNTWGPSYGLFQVRTLRSETGSGGDRDVTWLSTSDANQAAAAYEISNKGNNFAPWTTYTSGAYQQFLGQAQAAATAAGTATTTGSSSGPFPTFGPSWLPWNWPSDAANASIAADVGQLRNLGVQVLFLGGGLALLGLGAVKLFQPQLRRYADRQVTGARTALKIGALV